MLWQRKRRWMGHVLRHDGFLLDIIKPTRGSRRLQMLQRHRPGVATLDTICIQWRKLLCRVGDVHFVALDKACVIYIDYWVYVARHYNGWLWCDYVKMKIATAVAGKTEVYGTYNFNPLVDGNSISKSAHNSSVSKDPTSVRRFKTNIVKGVLCNS